MKTIAGLFVFVWGHFAFSQNSIRGTILDENGQAFQFIKVSITQLEKDQWTDSKGSYQFDNLPIGIYAIAVDYLYDIKYFTLPITCKDSVFNIQLNRRIEFNEIMIKSYQLNLSEYASVTKLNKAWIMEHQLDKDLPFVLSKVSSTVSQSDAGNGIGYTGIRLRGMDPAHVQITLNGIPFNDQESALSYFVDIPDIISQTNEIVILKGNVPNRPGSASFGGAIDINTNALSFDPYLNIQTNFGSYNSSKYSLLANSGLLENKFNLKFGLSRQKSDGYIDRASSDLKSFSFSAAQILANSSIRINYLYGSELTGQAWFGLPIQYAHIDSLRTKNTAGSQKPGEPYTQEVDQYKQNHVQGFYQKQLNPKASLNFLTNYTFGKGFYESYIGNAQLSKYAIESSAATQADLVQRRWLQNHFILLSSNALISLNKIWSLNPGVSWFGYFGDHFGDVKWVNLPDYKYLKNKFYNNEGKKKELTFNLKSTTAINASLNINADLQLRKLTHEINGLLFRGDSLKLEKKFTFFTPKIYADYRINKNWVVTSSAGYMQREPFREDLLNASQSLKHEQLLDFEAGCKFNYSSLTGSLNSYFMNYKNQLALTGEINEVGELLHLNLDNSSRIGIELETSYSFKKYFNFWVALNISRNKIKAYKEFVVDYVDASQSYYKSHTNSNISYSPESVLHTGLVVPLLPFGKKGPSLQLEFQYHEIGAMYLDNSNSKSAILPGYGYFECRVDLVQKLFKKSKMRFWIAGYNITNEKYFSHGWISSRFHSGEHIDLNGDPYLAKENSSEYYYKALYPQALRHFSLGLNFEFK